MKYNRKENLKVYLSTTNKMPSSKDCESEYVRPSVITLWATGRSKEFNKDYAYLTIICTSQVTVDFMVKFNTIERALGKKKLEQAILEQQGEQGKKKILTDKQEQVLNSISQSVIKNTSPVSKSHIFRNIKEASNWRQISIERLEKNKALLPKKLEEVKVNHHKIFLKNLRDVSDFYYHTYRENNLWRGKPQN